MTGNKSDANREALKSAAKNGDADGIRAAILAGADPRDVKKKSVSPLMHAAMGDTMNA